MYLRELFDWLKGLAEPAEISGMKRQKSDPETRRAFLIDCARINRISALVILTMTLLMECLMVLIYLLRPIFTTQAKFFPQYIYMYVSMIVFSACFLVLLDIMKRSPGALLKLQTAMLAAVSVWSAVFSAFDVINGFSSYLFIQMIMINSLAFRINPYVHCAVNAGGFCVYAVLVLAADLSLTITFAEIINPFLMMIAACVMIILNFQTKFTSYINESLIREQNRKLEFYANNDFLTKIPNRKSIEEYLDRALSENPGVIACMMVDIDDFKRYNDTYGHIMGDNCLIRIASIIGKHAAERGGRAGRYGGEEFLAIFTGKRKEQMTGVAEELISLVRDERIEFSESAGNLFVTVSIGMYIEDNPRNADKYLLISLADAALYTAKKEGKDKISVYRKAE